MKTNYVFLILSINYSTTSTKLYNLIRRRKKESIHLNSHGIVFSIIFFTKMRPFSSLTNVRNVHFYSESFPLDLLWATVMSCKIFHLKPLITYVDSKLSNIRKNPVFLIELWMSDSAKNNWTKRLTLADNFSWTWKLRKWYLMEINKVISFFMLLLFWAHTAGYIYYLNVTYI